MNTNPIASALESVSFGPEITFENVTMLPLLSKHVQALNPYLVLDDALAGGFAEITEVSDGGSVPELRFLNRSPESVLVIDGEELVGAKQNRVANLTILVEGKSELHIPVSCVEAGRWRARSRVFAAAPRAQYATGRAKRVRQVTESLRDRGNRASDQADVWADIAMKSARLNASSPTSAMEAIFTGHASSIDRFVDALRPVDGQVGAMFAVNGAIVALDLFEHESTLRKVLPKLVRSVAVDAIDRVCEPRDDSYPSARALGEQFLAVTAAAPQHSAKALGLGDDVRLTAPHVAGAALVVDGHVVHLGAFAL
jgi:hypothetical protein